MTRRAVSQVASGPGHVPDLPDEATWRRWGIDPSWSRRLDVASHAGGTRSWHVLDTGPPPSPRTPAGAPVPTIVCVHGNPTWAYVWKSFLRELGTEVRVVAVDQLGMGYSQRTVQRRFVDRVRDLDDVIVALDITGPLVLAGHDWGGAIAMGWVVQDPRQVAGIILCNTGIAVPAGRGAPAIIRLAASAPLLDAVCRGTSAFVEGTVRLSGRRLSRTDREAFRAPYRSAPLRAAIADFVDDIPFDDDDPSANMIADVAQRLAAVTAPVLLAWGAKDVVFDDDFAADLAARFPNVSEHRFAGAGHLVMAEADVAGVAQAWLRDVLAGISPAKRDAGRHDAGERDDAGRDGDAGAAGRPLWAAIDERADDSTEAIVDLASGQAVTWSELSARVAAVAAGLRRRGLRPGDRVAMLTPPGVDLLAAVYGVWRAGGVTVVADRGLGLRGLGAAVRSASPTWVIGPRRALLAARTLRWAPRATAIDVVDLMSGDSDDQPQAPPTPDDVAAILFTSGATGPAKGVRYLHGQLAAQRDALASLYSIVPADRLVAAFAPFALYGPALGIPTALPAADVTKPGELTADQLDEACTRIGATLAFASPAALGNVVNTAAPGVPAPGIADLRLVLSAGAPVPAELLGAVAVLAPAAELHTPYGMTEVLPVADIGLDGIRAADAADPVGGVCVGSVVPGAQVRIAELHFDALAVDPVDGPVALATGETGEIVVRAPWVSDGYDGLWATERAARPGDGRWHRSGDVGHLDDLGRLWVEGRSVHLIDTVGGPLTPVPIERVVERAVGSTRVAAVGVGPAGVAQLVIVVEDRDAGDGLAAEETVAAVRAAVAHPVAAVLTAASLPVDIRHNAKIDRAAVAGWAAAMLSGDAVPSSRRWWRRT